MSRGLSDKSTKHILFFVERSSVIDFFHATKLVPFKIFEKRIVLGLLDKLRSKGLEISMLDTLNPTVGSNELASKLTIEVKGNQRRGEKSE